MCEYGLVVHLYNKGGSQKIYERLLMYNFFLGLLSGETREDQKHDGEKYISISWI